MLNAKSTAYPNEEVWLVRSKDGKTNLKFILPSKGSGEIDDYSFVTPSLMRKCANIVMGKPFIEDGSNNLVVTKPRQR